MINTEKDGFIQLSKIALPYVLFSIAYIVLILFIEETVGDHIYKISGQIGSVFGLAVAFFLGFRMNSAYDRWWEARKIFGELTNNSRSMAAKIYVYRNNFKQLSQNVVVDLIDLIILYIRQLKNEMHDKGHANEEENKLFLTYKINKNHKISNELLLALADTIEQNFEEEKSIEKSDLMQHINRFYDIQGKAERIKNTPFLKIYSVFTKLIVSCYVLLIPLFIGDIDLGGEESKLEFLSVPIMAIISTAFLTINKLANLFGEPFSENRKTSVAIDNICKNIENNCLEVRTKI